MVPVWPWPKPSPLRSLEEPRDGRPDRVDGSRKEDWMGGEDASEVTIGCTCDVETDYLQSSSHYMPEVEDMRLSETHEPG